MPEGFPSVWLFGDYIEDIYHYVEPVKLSAEAPIPVFRETTWTTVAGGAGNVRANLDSLGMDVLAHYSQPYCRKHRYVVGDVQVARVDEDVLGTPFTGEELKWAGMVPKALVVVDYNKGAIGEEFKSVLCTVDPTVPMYVHTKRGPRGFPEWATFFVNEREYEQYRDEYDAASRLIITRGARGAARLSRGQFLDDAPAFPVQRVCSVCGAGDTFMAAYIRADLELPDTDPLVYANYAASLAVSRPLTSTVTKEEVDEILSRV